MRALEPTKGIEPSTTHLQKGGSTLRVGTAPGEGIEPTASFDHRLTVGHLAIRSTLECGEDHMVLPVFLFDEQERLPVQRKDFFPERAKVLLGFQRASDSRERIAARGEGLEPSTGGIRNRCPTIGRTPNTCCSGSRGNRTLAYRVRAGCSTFELQTRSGSGGQRSHNLPGKSRLLCRLSYESSSRFGPPLAGAFFVFIVVLVVFLFVWRGGVEPLAKRPPGYSRLELPLLRTHHVRWGLLSVDIVRASRSFVVSFRVPETPKAALSFLRRPSDAPGGAWGKCRL